MTNRVGMACVCLHISAALYAMLGMGMVVFLSMPPMREHVDGRLRLEFAFIGILLVGFIAGIELVAWGLRRRKFWAWIVGLCIFGLYLPSLFLPLGAFGLWGLLSAGTQAEFGIGVVPLGKKPAPLFERDEAL